MDLLLVTTFRNKGLSSEVLSPGASAVLAPTNMASTQMYNDWHLGLRTLPKFSEQSQLKESASTLVSFRF